MDYRILYFSGTGNTEWVAKKISEKLIQAEHNCQMLAADVLLAECGQNPGSTFDESCIRKRLSDFLPDAVTVILGFPVYASGIPKPLKQLFPYFPPASNRKLAVFATLLRKGDDVALVLARQLRGKGYKSFLGKFIKMPNNIRIPNFEFFNIENGAELDRFYQAAEQEVEEFVDHLVQEKKYFDGTGFISFVRGSLQRNFEPILAWVLSKKLFASDKCVKCRLCADTCPMGNISFIENKPVFGKDCCCCLRCYNMCPVNAVQMTEKTMDEDRFPRYKGFDGWKAPRIRKTGGRKQQGQDEPVCVA